MKCRALSSLAWITALFLIGNGCGRAADEPQSAEIQDLFTSAVVPRLRIEIPPAGIEILQQYEFSRNAPDQPRSNVLATVREGALVYTNVAIHLKGAMGSFRPIDDRPALTLNFDKHADGQRFHGLQKVHLNNSVQDPSYVSEQVSRELFLAAGIPTPRATHATVELNGKHLGLYVLVEGWNKQFLKRHFKNTKGNLWDGGFARDINYPLETNSGETPEDRSPLDALVEAARESELSDRLARIGQVLDLDRFYTFIAMEIMLAHWDGYCLNRNNYRIFHDLDSGRLVFLPHGLDQMFGVWRARPEGTITPQLRGSIAKAVVQTDEGRRRYLSRMSQLLTNVFKVELMTNRVNQLAEKVRPAFAGNRSELRRHEQAVASLQDRIIRRARSVREQLEEINTPLRFNAENTAFLSRWDSKTDNGSPVFSRRGVPSDTLQITAQGGRAYGSWRTTVLLEAGTYRFEGRIMAKELQFDNGVTKGGATLRVAGERLATMYPDVAQWKMISHEFKTGGLEDVELVCELRASKGWAWFDVASLKLVRVK